MNSLAVIKIKSMCFYTFFLLARVSTEKNIMSFILSDSAGWGPSVLVSQWKRLIETPILFYFRNQIHKRFSMITLRSYMQYFNRPQEKQILLCTVAPWHNITGGFWLMQKRQRSKLGDGKCICRISCDVASSEPRGKPERRRHQTCPDRIKHSQR